MGKKINQINKKKRKKQTVRFNYIHTSRCNPVSFVGNVQCNISLNINPLSLP